jgi:hypothetical protein
MGHWEDFLTELDIIEAKYWQHFRVNKLSDHYLLNEDENNSLRFAFKKDSDLSSDIKEECMELFKKYKSSRRMA